MTNKKFNPENFPNEKIVDLDVRPILAGGTDPFMTIMEKIRGLKPDEALHIINTFEPAPLYGVLGGKGFDHFARETNGVWDIYFFRSGNPEQAEAAKPAAEIEQEKVIELDVRNLEPPEPMVKILETLPKMDENTVLLVHHHREPKMLYPKLEERKFSAHCHQVEENYFKIVITKK